MFRIVRIPAVGAMALMISAHAWAGPEWIEGNIGHAGSDPRTAQPTGGEGTVMMISGGLGGLGDAAGALNTQDMFIINIVDPEHFSATLVAPEGSADFDSQLWLFTIDGLGLLGNRDTLPNPAGLLACLADANRDTVVDVNDLLALIDVWGPCPCCPEDNDCSGQVDVNDIMVVINAWGPTSGCMIPPATLGPMATDGTGQTIPGPGLYLLAISSAGTVPASKSGSIFAFACNPGEISGPDGPGASDAVSEWVQAECGSSELGAYHIALNGVEMSGLYLDIKPGGCPTPLNPGSTGNTPVAILGTGGFDSSLIDFSTIVIERADGIGGSVPVLLHPAPSLDDTATPFTGLLCGCNDSNGDSIIDLNVKFDTPTMAHELGLWDIPAGTTLPLVVRGTFINGTAFGSQDCVRIVPPSFDGGSAGRK